MQKDLISQSVAKVREGRQVFRNLKFYLIETEEPFHLPVEQIEALIEAGGGTLLRRLPKKGQ
jgi:hypothetical protein